MSKPRLLAVLALAALLAGCTNDDPKPTAGPTPTTSFGFSVPPVTHHWNPDIAQCPTLTGTAAGLTGPGTQVRGSHSPNQSLLWCSWTSSTASALLILSTAKRQEAIDAAWKIAGAPNSVNTPLPGVGEQALTGPDTGDQFHVVVRSGNAMLDVTLKTTTDDLASLHSAAPEIANDMLKVLRPA